MFLSLPATAQGKPRNSRHNTEAVSHGLKIWECLAGAVGFEPTVRGTKNRCLTTWLRPNTVPLDTRKPDPVQPLPAQKNHC
jgi:hypothetical protein